MNWIQPIAIIEQLSDTCPAGDIPLVAMRLGDCDLRIDILLLSTVLVLLSESGSRYQEKSVAVLPMKINNRTREPGHPNTGMIVSTLISRTKRGLKPEDVIRFHSVAGARLATTTTTTLGT